MANGNGKMVAQWVIIVIAIASTIVSVTLAYSRKADGLAVEKLTSCVNTNTTDIATIGTKQTAQEKQLDRIENKLDEMDKYIRRQDRNRQ